LPGAGVVGVAVVPGHEVGGAVGAVQLDAGDREVGVLEGAGGEDDRVVVAAQVLEREVGAELDVDEEADVPAAQDPVQRGDDLLDPRVGGGDAAAEQAEGCRDAVEQSDGDPELPVLDLLGLQQGLGGVHAGGAGADHGQTEGLLGGGHLTSVSWRGAPGRMRAGRLRAARRTSLCSDFRTTLYAKFGFAPATVSWPTCLVAVLTPGRSRRAARAPPRPRRPGCWSPPAGRRRSPSAGARPRSPVPRRWSRSADPRRCGWWDRCPPSRCRAPARSA